jgi:hypothetical protein
MRYTEKQVQVLYKILGEISRDRYEITVITPIEIDKRILQSILYNRYKPLFSDSEINRIMQYSTESEEDRNFVIIYQRRLGMLNTFINIIKLKEVPLYINKIPEVAKWRFQIGV